MPLKKCKLDDGDSGWKFFSKGKCFATRQLAIKNAIGILGVEKFKEEMSQDSSSAEVKEINRAVAKIQDVGNGYKILGQGKRFNTFEEAFEYQYGKLDISAKQPSRGRELVEELATAYISKKERDNIPKEDFADPEHEKYYIETEEDLKSAIKLYGKSKDISPVQVKKNIIKIAKRKGWESQLPEDWV